jgi:hypothetical protein
MIARNTPLSMEGNPHHSSAAYKRGVHSPALSDTSFHTTNLDSKEPILISITLSHIEKRLPKILNQ